MLDPSDRSLLLEALRPPEGYRLDRAVGTTYSLDLLAMLTTPLAFTFFEWEDENGGVTADPVKLLQALRTQADRITVFCQALEIKVPPADQRLTAYLESSVIAVRAPKGGVFHPKVWVLRFVSANKPVRYRFICASRNLTFDRCWDCLVVLDGELMDRKNAIAANHPLGDFIAALPGMAVNPAPTPTTTAVSAMAEEVRRVDWTLPEGVTDLAFYPMGLETRAPRPLGTDVAGRPLLILSPFLADKQIKKLVENARDAVLISRPDELAKLPAETRALFRAVYAFDPHLEESDEASGGIENGAAEPELSGLHAKVYVVDDGRAARLLMGSANATSAAFERNVEFLVELTGSKNDFGIDLMLKPPDKGQSGFLNLLDAWTGGGAQPSDEAVAQEALEKKLEDLKLRLASVQIAGRVTGSTPGGFEITLSSVDELPDLGGARLSCWPTTLRPDRAIAISGHQPLDARFGSLGVDALSSFVAFELRADEGSISAVRRFVCNVPIVDMPEDRLDRLVASVLSDGDNLMRLIWAMLEAQGLEADTDAAGSARRTLGRASGSSDTAYPLLERLLATIATEPRRIQDIGRLIEELLRTPEGARAVPPGLLQLWSAVKDMEVPDASEGTAP